MWRFCAIFFTPVCGAGMSPFGKSAARTSAVRINAARTSTARTIVDRISAVRISTARLSVARTSAVETITADIGVARTSENRIDTDRISRI